MKFLHLADLHLGKRLKEYSLIDDQNYILVKILNLIDKENPDAVLLAGDIYDKAIPPIEAINLLDDFLTSLCRKKIPVFIISGNHDSQDRMTFGSKLMQESGIYFSENYNISMNPDFKITPIPLKDNHGIVNIFLLPFVRPVEKSYTQAMKEAIERMEIDKNCRNVLVAHQLVTGSVRSESEDITIGTLEDVDASVFAPFDYVALGHIHKAQCCGSDKVWYSGTPLKYSFSEVNDKKGCLIVQMDENGKVEVRHEQLEPMRELRELKGSFNEITSKDFYSKLNSQDFYKIILTDEEDIPEGFGKLQKIYRNLLFLDYDNSRTKALGKLNSEIDIEKINPLEIFTRFFKEQNNMEMSEEQKDYAASLINDIWGEN